MSLVEKIAPACAWVAEQAQFVKINRGKIPAYADFIIGKYPVITEMESEHHYVTGDRETKAAYILALDSINFGSGYFHIAQECGVTLEYMVIAGGLKQAFERGAFRLPGEWAHITVDDFSQMLSVPLGLNPDLDNLLKAFQQHLREAGERIVAEYGGKVLNLLSACDYSAVTLADTVALWQGFHDVHAYKGRDIPILKRAQILAADMNLVLGGFSDIGKLTIFADNMVPHVLRCGGILEYNSDGLVVSGSEKEVEIRACAIHVVELMKQYAGGAMTAVNLDHMLWHRGYEPEIYNQKPHRTLSVWY